MKCVSGKDDSIAKIKESQVAKSKPVGEWKRASVLDEFVDNFYFWLIVYVFCVWVERENNKTTKLSPALQPNSFKHLVSKLGLVFYTLWSYSSERSVLSTYM